MSDWHDVATAMLGSWPSTVSNWRPEVLAAFIGQLEARGLTPDDAYTAILTWDGGDQIVPPTASQLASTARHDPGRPTPDEMLDQVYGPGGLLGFKRAGVTVHPVVEAWAKREGLHRLRELEVDGDHGHLVRNDLKESYAGFVEANENRDLAAILASRRGQICRFDALAALEGPDPQRKGLASVGMSG